MIDKGFTAFDACGHVARSTLATTSPGATIVCPASAELRVAGLCARHELARGLCRRARALRCRRAMISASSRRSDAL